MESQYIANLIKKNPSLQGGKGKMSLTVPEFLRHIQKAYKNGRMDMANEMRGHTKMPDFFRDIFN